jgi:hypothetical protein
MFIKMLSGRTPDSIKDFYIVRYAATGPSPFQETEIIKTEAAESISSHNGYKYRKYFSG